jgi:NAD-dependent SIR2 family protein deacetylase
LVSNADALVIAAGAGIGVHFGLPDFRGNTGKNDSEG